MRERERERERERNSSAKKSSRIKTDTTIRLIAYGTIRRFLHHSFALLFCSNLLQEIGKLKKNWFRKAVSIREPLDA